MVKINVEDLKIQILQELEAQQTLALIEETAMICFQKCVVPTPNDSLGSSWDWNSVQPVGKVVTGKQKQCMLNCSSKYRALFDACYESIKSQNLNE